MTHRVVPPQSSVVPAADEAVMALLQSIVDVARAIFGAAAGSIFLFDSAAHELVFQAVSGEGQEELVGARIPADRGIAGWVLNSGEALIVDELATSQLFAHDIAEATNYVPEALMAVPLISGEDILGVLEILDPTPQTRSDLSELDVLSLFANQAAVALRMAAEYQSQLTPEPSGLDRQMGVQLVDAFRDFLHQRVADR